jgi:hypothetical protein
MSIFTTPAGDISTFDLPFLHPGRAATESVIARLDVPAAKIKSAPLPGVTVALGSRQLPGVSYGALVRNIIVQHMPHGKSRLVPGGTPKLDIGTGANPSIIAWSRDLTRPSGYYLSPPNLDAFTFTWDDTFYSVASTGLQITIWNDANVPWSDPSVTCDDLVLYFDIAPLV